jgi:hypothetical protein
MKDIIKLSELLFNNNNYLKFVAVLVSLFVALVGLGFVLLIIFMIQKI